MTPSPSETALAIYKKYSMVSFQTKFNKGHCLPKEIAKKCAKIHVEGILQIMDQMSIINHYWQEILKQIDLI